LCSEIWTLNTPYIACVAWTGKLMRLLDTLDTTADFKLTYRTYTINAFAGSDNQASVPPDYFTSKVVDFAEFLVPSTAAGASALIASASISLAALSILY